MPFDYKNIVLKPRYSADFAAHDENKNQEQARECEQSQPPSKAPDYSLKKKAKAKWIELFGGRDKLTTEQLVRELIGRHGWKDDQDARNAAWNIIEDAEYKLYIGRTRAFEDRWTLWYNRESL